MPSDLELLRALRDRRPDRAGGQAATPLPPERLIDTLTRLEGVREVDWER